jgi:hypothetical protein
VIGYRGGTKLSNFTRTIVLGLAVAFATGVPKVWANDQSPMAAELRHIDNEWARVIFQVTDADEQEKQMHALAKEAAALVVRYPNRAEPLIWDGIVTSSEAKFAGGLRGIGLAKGFP